MKWAILIVTFFFILATSLTSAQAPATGPRTNGSNAVRLTPIPLGSTPAQIQALLDRHRNVYFKPGTYNIGTLRIKGWRRGLVWGAGRLTTNLVGNIVVSGSSKTTIGNFSLRTNAAGNTGASLEVSGTSESDLSVMNTLVTAGPEGAGLRIKAPGAFMVQGCSFTGNDIGITIEHPRARTNVFGGNLQSNRVHIQQVEGHLDARAFGVQIARGEADFVIHAPSPLGYHLIEGIRSEGSNGANANEVLVKVPQTGAAVNVAMRANSLGGMARFADYAAAGTLLLLENCNYPGSEDKNSVGVIVRSKGRAKVISIGNKYGLSYDEGPGPFVISPATTAKSVGDLWMLPNKDDYSRAFNEPVTADRMRAAGKAVPAGLSFPATTDSGRVQVPEIPLYKWAPCPRISNLAELMLNVKDFGAVPNDGRDDREAIQRALDSAEKGASEPIYFPAGSYELSAPLFLDHLAGGGFWGDGEKASVLVSTTGKGVLTSDGAGYATFVDIGFENRPGAETKTTDFDWVNNQSRDKKRGNTGAALQANLFYRCRFENGSIGMAVGKTRMGDSFLLSDCIFRNNRTAKGEGAAYASEGFNALTNPIIHCLFDKVDYAVLNAKGSFNFYGNKLTNIHSAALRFLTVVGSGFAIVNNEMDASPVPFITTGHSSAKAHLLIDRVRIKAAAKPANASFYTLGGSVMFLNSSFPARNITNGGGIGDNSLIIYKTTGAGATATGRAHKYQL